MGVEGMMTPHLTPASVVTGLQVCMRAGAAVEGLPHLCKKLPIRNRRNAGEIAGEMGAAAVRLLINSAQSWIKRISASFGPHPFQCRGGMKCCNVVISSGIL